MWHLLKPSLNFYTVHIRPEDERAWEHPVLVREGFNFWVLFLAGPWALYHGLWGLAVLIFALNALLLPDVAASWGISPEGGVVLQLGIQGCIAYVADDIRRHKLRRKGYIITDIVAEENELLATRRFFDRHAAMG